MMADSSKPKNRHITPKVLLGIFIAFLLTLGVFFAIDYSHYAKDNSPYRTLFIPRLELALINIMSLTADKTDLTANVMIHNPLPFNLRADSLAYIVYIRGVEVMRSTYAKSLDIKRWDTTVIHLPVTAYNDKLLSTLTEAEKEGLDSVEYEIKTNFGIQLFGHHDLHLDIKTRQPLVFIPSIKVTSIEYDHLKPEGVDLYIKTLITNKNKIRLQAKNIQFKVAVADDPYVKGSYPGVLDILDSGATTPMTLKLHLSFKEIGKSIGPLIKHGKNTPYNFEATLELVSDMNAMKNSQVIIADKGVIHDIVKLAKDEKVKSDEKLRAQGIDPKQHKKEMKKERKEKRKEGKGIHFGKKKDDINTNQNK
jgi:LEA14-like dessication related protein